MPALETYFVTVAATITSGAAVYTAKKARDIAGRVQENEQRSQTNRRALRAVIQDDSVDIDADPITGLREGD